MLFSNYITLEYSVAAGVVLNSAAASLEAAESDTSPVDSSVDESNTAGSSDCNSFEWVDEDEFSLQKSSSGMD